MKKKLTQSPRILIALSTFNRPIITEICLESISSFRSKDIRLVIYDDASSKYDRPFLEHYADEVVRFERNGGIERSRAKSFRDFRYRFTDYDLLYLTDNDTLHDPEAMEILLKTYQDLQANNSVMPISLFNSSNHMSESNIIDRHKQGSIIKTLPGVSQCYDRSMVEVIVDGLNQSAELESKHGWDWDWPALLKSHFFVTKHSYLEHFCRDRDDGGMHAPYSGLGFTAKYDFEHDRAINPTDYLIARRDSVIDQILGVQQTVKDYEAIFPEQEGQVNTVGGGESDKNILMELGKILPDAVEVLDIGFGTGSLGHFIANNSELSQWRVDGIDGYEKACKNPTLVEKKYYRNIWWCNAENLTSDRLKKYQLICILDVIEHLQIDDAKLLLRQILSGLNEGSYLFLSTPLWFYPQGHIEAGDLEEHLIGVPASALLALKPIMYSVGPQLVGGFIFTRDSLQYIDQFEPTTDRDFTYERGIQNAIESGLSLDIGVVNFLNA
ncbi:methyltransferase domain-containing protein [Polynucleobacter paneuropaeus]|nr:methyltransferase domain-containing protein [Polynucleobacter paneuropaeus]MBT8530993.1 methyltransferase domain-containing protein [Polynucleobacter paneuropaeus]MBT8602450.1 methyltransferase domain-containing protein [Polynucleobacter paneuropaeus]MBT8624403.1 methyltransferase domain-containing protein [Polynucleobacter paneuropaeus]MBT8628712.1 methyltransferase domain-containing protein [Polynucleobacter paneuropaeus]